jgi:hypothetical protein
MIIQHRFAQFLESNRTAQAMDEQPAGVSGMSRLVQVVLALYLIPALLIVLAVGGCGMLILACVRALTAIMGARNTWPHTPVGPVSHSSDMGFDNRRP